jgi:hypothetical protein
VSPAHVAPYRGRPYVLGRIRGSRVHIGAERVCARSRAHNIESMRWGIFDYKVVVLDMKDNVALLVPRPAATTTHT